MRFNKACIEPLTYPLTAIPDASKGLVNPCIGSNIYEVPAPTMPEDGEIFYDEVLEVIMVRENVKDNVFPNWFFEDHGLDPRVPQALREFGGIKDARSAASAVHMDQPIDLGLVCIKWANKKGYKFTNTVEGEGHIDFLSNPVNLIAQLAINIEESLQECFRVKYFFGRPRPEEATGWGNSFTHYPEGAPAHCAYPAGHASVAGATYATIADFYELDEAGKKELENITKHFCHYRVLAGVHYFSDGIGWDLGVAVSRDLATVAEVTL